MSNSPNQNLILVEGAATYERILEAVRDDDMEEGILYLKDFLKIYPEFAKAHNDLAVLYHRSGDSLKALAHYEKALKLDPGNVTYRKNLADFYFVEIEWTGEAVHIYLDILKDNPFDTEALNALGTINHHLGRKEKARKFFGKTLQIDPANQEAQLALQQLAPTGAQQMIPLQEPAPQQLTAPPPVNQPVAQNIPSQPVVGKTAEEYYREALWTADALNLDQRIALLEKALEINPTHPFAHNDLGVLYQKTGDPRKSRFHHEEAARLQPDNALFRKNLADLLCVEFGELETALGIYVALYSDNRYDVELLKAIAHVCIEIGNRDDARFFFEQILTMQPWDREAIDALKALNASDGSGIAGAFP